MIWRWYASDNDTQLCIILHKLQNKTRKGEKEQQNDSKKCHTPDNEPRIRFVCIIVSAAATVSFEMHETQQKMPTAFFCARARAQIDDLRLYEYNETTYYTLISSAHTNRLFIFFPPPFRCCFRGHLAGLHDSRRSICDRIICCRDQLLSFPYYL